MKNQKKNLLALGFIFVLGGLISAYIYKDLNKPISETLPKSENSPNLSPVSINPDQPNQGYKVEVVDSNDGQIAPKLPKTPNLDLPIVNYNHLDDAAFKIVATNIGILVDDLKKDPKDESKWLGLGI